MNLNVAQNIIQQPVAALLPYARNSRTHSDEQVAQIAASIREFGFTNPVLVDHDNGIVAGHGRVMAAQLLGLHHVPTINVGWMTDTQRRAYIIADNKLAINAGWDNEALSLELSELGELGFDLDLLGFNEDEMDGLLAEETPAGLTDEDAVPEVQPNPISKPGDMWQLGRHRLLCGDASQDADAFLSGIAPDMLYLDPPYEIEAAWGWIVGAPKALVFTDHKHIREAMGVVLKYPVIYHFVWDTIISWYTQNRPLCRHRSAFYCSNEPGWNADACTYVDGKEREEKTVIGGQAFAGDYHYQPLSGGRVRVTSVYKQGKTLDEAGNGKPVAWTRALLNGADARVVFEPFAGTGATIIAAPDECTIHAIEIDPGKVDLIVARWEQFTGGKATRT